MRFEQYFMLQLPADDCSEVASKLLNIVGLIVVAFDVVVLSRYRQCY
jgi:hypothetical protein